MVFVVGVDLGNPFDLIYIQFFFTFFTNLNSTEECETSYIDLELSPDCIHCLTIEYFYYTTFYVTL